MPTSSTKRAPARPRSDAVINLRVAGATRDLIDTAAAATGKTRTEFVIESARQHATDVLLDRTLHTLDGSDYGSFIEVLDNPPAPTEKLKRLLRHKAPWEA